MRPVAAKSPTFLDNMRPAQAAEYLSVSKSFLDQARVTGTGPQYSKLSATLVIYRRADLDAFLAARVVRSTSEEITVA
jgi:hypothetical protein